MGGARKGCADLRIARKDRPVVKSTKKKPAKKKAAAKAKPAGIDEKALNKGQLRKLGTLRKSLGNKIADKAFAEWLKAGATAPAEKVDKNAQLIADALGELVNAGKLRIPRGGYLVTRGRKRVIVSGSGVDIGG